MKKLLLIPILISVLSACQSPQTTITLIKEEPILKEKLIKLKDSELLSILRKKASETEIKKDIGSYAVFVRCKIDGTDCLSLPLYHNEAKEISSNEEVFIRSYDDFFKLSYLKGEFLKFVHYETSAGDRLTLRKGYREYHQSIVAHKNEESTAIVDDNIVYLKGI